MDLSVEGRGVQQEVDEAADNLGLLTPSPLDILQCPWSISSYYPGPLET